MKKLAVFCLMLGFSPITFCQQKTFSLTKEEYVKKSKQQKKNAHILLVSGGILLFTAVIISIDDIGNTFSNEPHKNSTAGETLTITGWAAGLTSIPFFIASSKNKKRAAALTFENQRVPVPLNTSLIYKTIPAMSIIISF